MKNLNNLIKKIILSEITYNQFKNEDKKPRQKIGGTIKLIRKRMNEIKKLVQYNAQLKEEMGMGSGDYWKSTRKDLHELSEQLHHLSNQIRNLGN